MSATSASESRCCFCFRCLNSNNKKWVSLLLTEIKGLNTPKRACLFAKGHSSQSTIASHTHLSRSGSVCYDMTTGDSRCVCVARRASGILTQLSQKPPPPAASRGGGEHPWRAFKREVCTGSDTERQPWIRNLENEIKKPNKISCPDVIRICFLEFIYFFSVAEGRLLCFPIFFPAFTRCRGHG